MYRYKTIQSNYKLNSAWNTNLLFKRNWQIFRDFTSFSQLYYNSNWKNKTAHTNFWQFEAEQYLTKKKKKKKKSQTQKSTTWQPSGQKSNQFPAFLTLT